MDSSGVFLQYMTSFPLMLCPLHLAVNQNISNPPKAKICDLLRDPPKAD